MAGFQKGKKKIHIYPSVTSVQCKPGTFSGLVDNAAILSRTVNSCSNYYDQLQNMSVVGALQTLSNPKAIPGLSHITAWTQSFDLCWKWNNKLLILPLSGHSDDTACAGGGGLEGRIHRNKKEAGKINGGPPTVTLRRTHSWWHKALCWNDILEPTKGSCAYRERMSRAGFGKGGVPHRRDEGKAHDDINPARCHSWDKDAHR